MTDSEKFLCSGSTEDIIEHETFEQELRFVAKRLSSVGLKKARKLVYEAYKGNHNLTKGSVSLHFLDGSSPKFNYGTSVRNLLLFNTSKQLRFDLIVMMNDSTDYSGVIKKTSLNPYVDLKLQSSEYITRYATSGRCTIYIEGNYYSPDNIPQKYLPEEKLEREEHDFDSLFDYGSRKLMSKYLTKEGKYFTESVITNIMEEQCFSHEDIRTVSLGLLVDNGKDIVRNLTEEDFTNIDNYKVSLTVDIVWGDININTVNKVLSPVRKYMNEHLFLIPEITEPSESDFDYLKRTLSKPTISTNPFD